MTSLRALETSSALALLLTASPSVHQARANATQAPTQSSNVQSTNVVPTAASIQEADKGPKSPELWGGLVKLIGHSFEGATTSLSAYNSSDPKRIGVERPVVVTISYSWQVSNDAIRVDYKTNEGAVWHELIKHLKGNEFFVEAYFPNGVKIFPATLNETEFKTTFPRSTLLRNRLYFGHFPKHIIIYSDGYVGFPSDPFYPIGSRKLTDADLAEFYTEQVNLRVATDQYAKDLDAKYARRKEEDREILRNIEEEDRQLNARQDAEVAAVYQSIPGRMVDAGRSVMGLPTVAEEQARREAAAGGSSTSSGASNNAPASPAAEEKFYAVFCGAFVVDQFPKGEGKYFLSQIAKVSQSYYSNVKIARKFQANLEEFHLSKPMGSIERAVCYEKNTLNEAAESKAFLAKAAEREGFSLQESAWEPDD